MMPGKVIATLSRQQKFLAAIIVHLSVTSNGHAFHQTDVQREYCNLYADYMGGRLNPGSEFGTQMQNLAATGLIRLHSGRGKSPKVELGVSREEFLKGVGEHEALWLRSLCRPRSSDSE